MFISSLPVCDTYCGSPALKFSTLLEVTVTGTIYSHESCTRLTRCTHVCVGFKGDI